MKHETKQVYYNQVKGKIIQINDSIDFPSVTLQVGHSRTRNINILFKREQLNDFQQEFNLDDEVTIMFFVSSRFKHERWYTNVNCIEYQKKTDSKARSLSN